MRNFRSSEDLDPYPATDAPTSPTPSTAKSRQSEWNARNLFTGWVNAPLTTAGEQAAIQAGQLLAQEGLWPDVVHTSVLRRTIRTADLALTACDRDWIPVQRSWRLNANHYGALQGRDKADVAAEAGDIQVMLWRRLCAVAPPAAPAGHPYSQFDDPRYAGLPPEARPHGESLDGVVGVTSLLSYVIDDTKLPATADPSPTRL